MPSYASQYFTNDTVIQRYEQQIIEKENMVQDLLQDLQDLINDKSKWKQLAGYVQQGEVTQEDVDFVHKAFADSFAKIRSGKLYGVPFIWRTLPEVYAQKVVQITRIRNTDIPTLHDKIDRRMIGIIRQLKKQTGVAKDASGVALIRNTPVHSVWSVIAKRMSSRTSV